MSMIKINRNPSRRELIWFGALLPIFFAALGAVARWIWGAPGVANWIWMTGIAVTVVFAVAPPLRRLLYVGWMYAALPIGWTISHLLLGGIYFFIFTPIGLLMWLFRYDPMHRRFDKQAQSYWIPRDTSTHAARYFRQF